MELPPNCDQIALGSDHYLCLVRIVDKQASEARFPCLLGRCEGSSKVSADAG